MATQNEANLLELALGSLNEESHQAINYLLRMKSAVMRLTLMAATASRILGRVTFIPETTA